VNTVFSLISPGPWLVLDTQLVFENRFLLEEIQYIMLNILSGGMPMWKYTWHLLVLLPVDCHIFLVVWHDLNNSLFYVQPPHLNYVTTLPGQINVSDRSQLSCTQHGNWFVEFSSTLFQAWEQRVPTQSWQSLNLLQMHWNWCKTLQMLPVSCHLPSNDAADTMSLA